jgi:hypothetical protein
VITSALLFEPLTSLLGCLPFILRKDLGATLMQLSLQSALKPVLALFSFYLTSSWRNGVSFLRANLLLTGLGARLPFLLFPFVDNVWFFVLSSSLYPLFFRAGMPAWMELLRCNVPEKDVREKIFSLGSVISYTEGMLIAIGLGLMLDKRPEIWKTLFFFSGAIGIGGVLLQIRLPICKLIPEITEAGPTKLKELLLKPWTDTIYLMKTNKAFALFQWAFMAGGFGTMFVLNVLPFYCVDVLDLSHGDFTRARILLVGLGFVLSTPLWTRALRKYSINYLSCIVCGSFSLYPLFLLLAQRGVFWIDIAHIFYGISQGGSHLVWHLSGPIFSKGEDSSRYSGVNLVTVGIRGIIAPFISLFLYQLFGAGLILTLGVFLCLVGGYLVASRTSLRRAQT